MTIPHARIRSELRRIWWRYSKDRQAAKDRAKVRRGVYLCEGCYAQLGAREIEIDHMTPCGSTPGSRLAKDASWDVFIARLFCASDGLQVLCRACHLGKSVRDKGGAA